MKLFIALYLLFGIEVYAANPTFEEIREGDALERAEAAVDLIRSWINEPDELRTQLKACAIGSPAFIPNFDLPPKFGELAQKLCQIMPPFRAAPYYNLGKLPDTGCKFVSYSPCKVQFVKRIAFKDKVGIIPVKAENNKLYNAVNYEALDITHLAVQCDLVSIAGLLPKWICGSGFVRDFYFDADIKFGLSPYVIPKTALNHLKYEEMNTAPLLTKFLEVLNLPK